MIRGRLLSGVVIIFALSFVASVLPALASATAGQVVIEQIVYDPPGADTGHEWIELVNAGTSSVRLSDLRLRVSGANHNIVPLSGLPAPARPAGGGQAGDGTLALGLHAAIVQDPALFAQDDPSFAGSIFHSSFLLANKSGEVALIDKAGAVIASKSYEAPPPAPPVPKQKVAKSKKTTSKNIRPGGSLASSAADDQGASTDIPTAPQAAAAGETGARSTSLWWIGTIALASAAGVATFASRRVAKREWDISGEETN